MRSNAEVGRTFCRCAGPAQSGGPLLPPAAPVVVPAVVVPLVVVAREGAVSGGGAVATGSVFGFDGVDSAAADSVRPWGGSSRYQAVPRSTDRFTRRTRSTF